ncbi:MAG: TonB-dependent receptor [Caulobacter sp.]|nr:TonB-dependent receptor [Caulobacter sp.]
MSRMKTALALGVSLTALASGQAMAQDAKHDEAMMITEVVVTAQKREEKLQDVPIAVSVVGETDLQRRNIGNIDQLKLVVPSFESTSFGVSVRGVGTSTFSTSIEPTVSTVLDGVVLGRPEMALGSFYDVARVEILRGPQGMLFGKNASAGLVNITTNAPKLNKTEALANINVGQDGYHKSDATLNLPVGENAAIRLGAYVNKLDGVLHNKFDGRRFNGNDEWGTRAKLLWRPTDTVDVLVTADYSKQDQSITWSPYKVNPTGALALVYAGCGVKASPENTDLCIDGPQYKDRENYGLVAEVNWSLPGGQTLTSITAGRRAFDLSNGDSDSLPVNILNDNISNQDLRQISQELRLSSPTGGRLEYVAGLYFYRQKTNQTTDQTGSFGLPFGLKGNSTINSLVETTSYAAFGQAHFDLTEKLALIGGARLTHDKVSLDFNQFTRAGYVAINPTVRFDDSATETNFSWRIGAQYQFAQRTMGYATVSRGYKGPGFNQTGVSNATTSQEVGPEIPTSYELGVKTGLLGGLAVVNVAAFSTKFEDYQAQTVDFTLTPPAFRTINAGDLKTKGVEADLSAYLAPGLMVSAAVAYIDAKYGDFAPISCDPVVTPTGCVVIAPGIPGLKPPLYGYDASGQRLSGVSKWKTSFAAVYSRPIGHGLEFNASADYGWRDGYNASATRDPNTYIKSYGILGATIGIGSEDDRWKLAVWGKNLTDKRFPSSLFGTPFAGAGDYSQVLTGDAFRRYGVTLNLRY